MIGEGAQREPRSKPESPIDVFHFLPRTNCKKCGEQNCLSFAAKVAARESPIEKCPPFLEKKYAEAYEQLKKLLKPAVRLISVGVGEQAVRIGGKLAMYRHESAFLNPTAIAIDVSDTMPEEEILGRIRRTEKFSFDYIGQTLKLDMVAVRSASGDSGEFKTTVQKVAQNTHLPLILCSPNAGILEAGLTSIPSSRPLLYAANESNWRETAELALTYHCSLAVSAPNDLSLIRSLTRALLDFGVEDLVLDPGTFVGDGLADTLNNLAIIRRTACARKDELLGFPLMGVPLVVWTNAGQIREEILMWREAYLAAMLVVRFADILIMHSVDGWSLLPTVVLRQNIYADPRKPAAVGPGLRVLGSPNKDSPVMFTTNFALTYYTVFSDLELSKTDAYLLVIDTGGIAVDSAVAGRKLTADKIANALKNSGVAEKVRHMQLIIPGKAASLAGEIEELSGWRVLVGPKDSSDIPKFLKEKWKPATIS